MKGKKCTRRKFLPHQLALVLCPKMVAWETEALGEEHPLELEGELS